MKYFTLTKPGIIFGNVVTACGGFFLAVQGSFPWLLFLYMLLGLSLVIASGCVINNVVDRDIDSVMQRTKNRVMVLGLVSVLRALLYASVLGVLGIACLYFYVNSLTASVALFAWLIYTLAYTLLLKRRSTLGVMVGGIGGALPPVIGYCALTAQLDLMALVLFAILFFWQLPHFYAIGINRREDFVAANIPVLVIKKGVNYTKLSSLFFVALFTFCATLPAVIGPLSTAYFFVALLLGTCWFGLGLLGFFNANEKQWAQRMFSFSIVSITVLSFMMAMHR